MSVLPRLRTVLPPAAATALSLVALLLLPTGIAYGAAGRIALRASTSAHNAVATSLTLPVPAARVAGDVMIATLDVMQAPTVTAPGGWALVRTDTNPSGNHLKQAVYRHVVSASEPAGYTWTFSSAHGAGGGILEYSGVDTASPVDASAGQAVASATSVAAPSATTATTGTLLVGLFGAAGDRAFTSPSTMTPRFTNASASTPGEKVTAFSADEPLAGAGATGSRTARIDLAAAGVGELVALRPSLGARTGTVTEFGVAGTAVASGIATGADGNVWFTLEPGPTASNRVGRVTPSGSITLLPIPSPGNSGGITAGPDGNVWFTEFNANRLARVRAVDGMIMEFPFAMSNVGAGGITTGSDGNLWVALTTTNKIGRVTTGGAITEFRIPTQGAFPHGLQRGPDGNVWFAEFKANKIAKITPGGTVTEYPLPVAGSSPDFVASGPDGNMWFTELARNRIGRISLSGAITEFPIPTAASQPVGICAGPDGNLWFTEQAANKIGRITTTGVVTEFPLPTPASAPDKITAGADGNLWFSEHNAVKVGRIVP